MWSIWTHDTFFPGCLSNKQEDWRIPLNQMSSKKLIFVLFRCTFLKTVVPELTVLCCHGNLFEGWDIEVETQSSDAKQVFLRKFVVYGKVLFEINYTTSARYISVHKHFRENQKVPAERPWKMQSFGIWYIFVGQIL